MVSFIVTKMTIVDVVDLSSDDELGGCKSCLLMIVEGCGMLTDVTCRWLLRRRDATPSSQGERGRSGTAEREGRGEEGGGQEVAVDGVLITTAGHGLYGRKHLNACSWGGHCMYISGALDIVR